MIKFIKRYSHELTLSLYGAVLAIPVLGAYFAQAAADPVLEDVIASTTEYINENKSVMIDFYIELGLISLGVGVAIGAILVSIKWIKRALFGGRRRR